MRLNRATRMLNELAWLQATCPEAKARDGKQAVEHATRACELSAWKEAAFLDTARGGPCGVWRFQGRRAVDEESARAGTGR